MNLSSFLKRLRYEAMPPVPEPEEESGWSPTVNDAASPVDPPSVPWHLSTQDVNFLKRRLHIDPDR
jgi:hypothetical protein